MLIIIGHYLLFATTLIRSTVETGSSGGGEWYPIYCITIANWYKYMIDFVYGNRILYCSKVIKFGDKVVSSSCLSLRLMRPRLYVSL